MTGYGFLRVIQALLAVGLLVLLGLAACVWCISSEISLERQFRHSYGAEWQVAYKKEHGSLAEARGKAAASGIGLVAISGLSAWLWRILRPSGHPGRANRRRHEYRSPRQSHLERTITCRRKALLGIYFGVPGIFLGAFLVIFRCGIFVDHSNEVVLGLFVFLAGYAGISTGCAYWLKAKQWNEAIVVIGLAPVGIFFVPFVRLLLFANLELLPVGLFMTSLILVVVVFALPDRSGISNRRHFSRRARKGSRPLNGLERIEK
jgi:hypothetical protein